MVQVRILVTGGSGYIGSHQAVALLEAGHEVVVIDNLSNSHAAVKERIEKLTAQRLVHYETNMLDTSELRTILEKHEIEATIHFAGHKHVRESISAPISYYKNNVGGIVSLVEAALCTPMRKIVFSSSGSIYGETTQVPIAEEHAIRPSNPYSQSKAVCEQLLVDVCQSDPSWSIASLRYFNPAGAHYSGLLGDASPVGATNLLPVLMEVAAGLRDHVNIYGCDFDTPDGSGVRDYIHIDDVVECHMRALTYLENNQGHTAVNLGRGEGISVLQMIAAVEQVTKESLCSVKRPGKPGDVSALFGETTKAQKLFGDIRYKSLLEIVGSAWRFQQCNPGGYPE